MAASMGVLTRTFENICDVAKANKIPLTFFALGGLGLLTLRRWAGGGVCSCTTRLDGRTTIVTGANTGIGYQTAKDFAARGARVILACRNVMRGTRAADRIISDTGNGNVIVLQLDLTSLKSVRNFTSRILETERQLHILVNNAGVMRVPHWKTEDGFEYHMGVNHLGHFLLTYLLLDLLKASAPSRIVVVSSNAYKYPKAVMDFEDLMWEMRSYDDWGAYGQSKLANIYFTRQLSNRLKGSNVTVNSLHPGVIRTELGRYFWPKVPLWRRILFTPILLLVFKSPWQGAQTTIHCAVSPSLANVSGSYFGDCKEEMPKKVALDDESAAKLWKASEALTGVVY